MVTANANADSHLQKYEKKKIGRENKTDKIAGTTTISDTIIGDFLHRNMIKIPIAIDPFGQFGPILQTFLFNTEPTNPITFTPIKPNATLMYYHNITHPQAQKASSNLPAIIGNSHKCCNSADTPTPPQHQRLTPSNKLDSRSLRTLQFIFAMLDEDILTTLLLPLHLIPPFLSIMVN